VKQVVLCVEHQNLIETDDNCWVCTFCKVKGTLDEVIKTPCNYEYPPCPFCGGTPVCVEGCAGVQMVLTHSGVRLLDDVVLEELDSKDIIELLNASLLRHYEPVMGKAVEVIKEIRIEKEILVNKIKYLHWVAYISASGFVLASVLFLLVVAFHK
jgi:hypothetical protein